MSLKADYINTSFKQHTKRIVTVVEYKAAQLIYLVLTEMGKILYFWDLKIQIKIPPTKCLEDPDPDHDLEDHFSRSRSQEKRNLRSRSISPHKNDLKDPDSAHDLEDHFSRSFLY